jgi:hypothetical protein
MKGNPIQGSGLALDAESSVYVTGYTTFSKASFPTTPGAYDRTPNGGVDAFIVKFGDAGPARPRAVVTANGSAGPVTLTSGDPLNVKVAFDLRGAAPLNPAEVCFGVYTQLGQFWWDPASQTFGTTPTPLYAGPLGNFGPSTVVNLPNAGVLTPGPYLWFMVVDNDANGQPDNEFFESVLTVIQ